MKIPALLHPLLNYHPRDKLNDLGKSINHQPDSVFVRLWNRLVRGLPFIGKALMISRLECQCSNKKNAQFDIKKDNNARPYITPTGNGANLDTLKAQDFFLLPIPHSQQSSPNGCVEACFDMLGCYFNCENLKAQVDIHADGLRMMPDTGRKLLRGYKDSVCPDLYNNGLTVTPISHTESEIKYALTKGPILAMTPRHTLLVVGYHGNHLIINDPWRGGHISKPITWLIRKLNHGDETPLLLITYPYHNPDNNLPDHQE